MTNKQIIKEGMLILCYFVLSTIIFSLANHKQNIYVSDIYVGTTNAEGNWYDFFLNLNFLAGIIFFFPALFVINTIRLLFNRFSLKYLAVFHLFISFVSLIITLIAAGFIHQIDTFFSNSMTLYPPLSAIPEVQPSTSHMSYRVYFAYCFCLVQLCILILTIIKINRNHQQS